MTDFSGHFAGKHNFCYKYPAIVPEWVNYEGRLIQRLWRLVFDHPTLWVPNMNPDSQKQVVAYGTRKIVENSVMSIIWQNIPQPARKSVGNVMGWKIARQLMSKDLLGILEAIYTNYSAIFSSNKQLPCWPCAAANLVLKAPSLSSKWWRWRVGPLSREKQWSSNHGPGVFAVDGWDCYPGTPREGTPKRGWWVWWLEKVFFFVTSAEPIRTKNVSNIVKRRRLFGHVQCKRRLWALEPGVCPTRFDGDLDDYESSTESQWMMVLWETNHMQCYVLSLNSRQLDSSDVAMSPSFAGLVMVKAQWNNHFNVGPSLGW